MIGYHPPVERPAGRRFAAAFRKLSSYPKTESCNRPPTRARPDAPLRQGARGIVAYRVRVVPPDGSGASGPTSAVTRRAYPIVSSVSTCSGSASYCAPTGRVIPSYVCSTSDSTGTVFLSFVMPASYPTYVCTVYCTHPVRAFFQLINRSARNPTRLFCQSDVRTVVATAGLSGAPSICTDASRLTSIVTPPSSAYRMQGGDNRITFAPTV